MRQSSEMHAYGMRDPVALAQHGRPPRRVRRPIDKDHSLMSVPSIDNVDYANNLTTSDMESTLLSETVSKLAHLNDYSVEDELCHTIHGTELDERWSEMIANAEKRLNKNKEDRVQVTQTLDASVKVRNGTYEFVDYNGSIFDKQWIDVQSNSSVFKNAQLYQKYYLGVQTARKAEEQIKVRGQWGIYHQVATALHDAVRAYSDRSDYPGFGQLCVVYREVSSGSISHFTIRNRKQKDDSNAFYVDYGDPTAPTFATVFGLLGYYNTNAHLKHDFHPLTDALTLLVEVFPLWNRPATVPTVSEFSTMSSEAYSWVPGDSIFNTTAASVSKSFGSSGASTTNRSDTERTGSTSASSVTGTGTSTNSTYYSSMTSASEETSCEFN